MITDIKKTQQIHIKKFEKPILRLVLNFLYQNNVQMVISNVQLSANLIAQSVYIITIFFIDRARAEYCKTEVHPVHIPLNCNSTDR